ncbi:MAG: DUF1924 domain-containing protein [Alphaproteobacteria bacterium]|nr:MAG: DUF1924 domain-containing protein [Alphaproteobacteria bacterium]
MTHRLFRRGGLVLAVALAAAGVAFAETPAQILQIYEGQAGGKGDPAAGRALFFSRHSGGKPETPACTVCHTENLKAQGRTRAGKVIEPMAPSVNPQRLTDPKKVAKWLRRNCKSVLGRECSAKEKADIIAFLMTQ